ncbi:MAG: type II secretion system F family protein [Phycisphaerales bacterium]|nr:type II secretion system F family protein [Phycisphaerales bacterium]
MFWLYISAGIIALLLNLPLLCALYVHVRLKLRREHAYWMLRTLSLAFARNLPLAVVLRSAANAEPGVFGRRMRLVADQLSAGDGLATALRLAFPVVPGEIVGAIDAAERAGTLPSVIRTLAGKEARRKPSRDAMIGFLFFWGGVMLAVQLLFSLGYAIFILPKLRAILSDFKLDIPPFTMAVFGMVGAMGTAPVAVLIVISVFLLIGQFLFMRYSFMRRPDRVQLFARLGDFISWHSPFRRAADSAALARQIPVLGASIESGHDLSAGARHAAMVDANWFARRRMSRWAERIEAGTDPFEAARRCGFPGAFLLALQKGRDNGDLGASLEFLGAYYESLVNHWRRIISALFAPLVIVILGATTLALLLAIWLPIIQLIETTCDSVY